MPTAEQTDSTVSIPETFLWRCLHEGNASYSLGSVTVSICCRMWMAVLERSWSAGVTRPMLGCRSWASWGMRSSL